MPLVVILPREALDAPRAPNRLLATMPDRPEMLLKIRF